MIATKKLIKAPTYSTYFFKKKKFKVLYIYTYSLEMTGNHGKFYSYKIYIKYPCGDSVKLFFWNIYLFSQNSFKKKNSQGQIIC